ncbi:MAG: Diacylglycerol kinase [Gemmatimonadaceae bacterium]|nr:Diacylglycerol kinase [Gemmatimonadaceae bacterium]
MAAVRRGCAEMGIEVRVHETTGPGDATRAARRSEGMDAVFALGGDGTVAEVAEALAGTGVALGILPSGTGNLVARALGIPTSPLLALRCLADGGRRAVDLARVVDGPRVGRRTVFAAGAGVDATMVADASGAMKRRLGVFTYFVTASRAVLAERPFTVRARVDGKEVTCDASIALVANFGAVLGGLIHLGPDIVPDDGLLDLCVLSPRGLRDAMGIAWRLVRNDFRPHPRMSFMKGRSIELATEPIRPLQSDGDSAGETPVHFVVEPAALVVLVPAR